MPDARTQSLTIAINGLLSDSVLQSVSRAEQILKDFGASTKTTSAAMKAVYSTAFQLPPGAQKGLDRMNAFQSTLSKITTGVASVSVGNLLAQGMEQAVQKAQEFANFIGDAVKQAGMFTRTKEQLAIELGKGPDDPYTKQIMDKMQEYSFQTHLVPDVLIEAFRQTKSSGFSDPEVFKHIQEIANISAATVPHGQNASEAFLELMDAFNKAAKGGAALERTLYMFEKRGVALRGIMARLVGLDVPADIVNLDPDDPRASAIDTQLAKLIRARKVPFSAVGGAITDLGAPGGKYGQAGLQQSKDLLGAESIIAGWGAMLNRELGHALEGPLVDLLNKVNSVFNWEKFKATQDFLDQFAARSQKAFTPILDELSKHDFSKLGADATKTLDALIKLEEKSGPLINFVTNIATLQIDGLIRLATAITQVATQIEKAFGWATRLFQGPQTTTTQSDAVFKARERLNSLVEGSASDDQIAAAKADLIAAEKSQAASAEEAKKALDGLNKAADKVSGNDLVHLNYAIEASTAAFLRLTASMGRLFPSGGPAGSPGANYAMGNFPIAGMGGSGLIRAEGYGPAYGEFGQTMGNHQNALQPSDYAVSQNLAAGHKIGDYFTFLDAQGKQHRGRYEDTSMKAPGVPNRDIIEGWNEPDRGRIKELLWEKKTSSAQPITVNNHYTIQALDHSGIDNVLRSHGDRIKEHLMDLMAGDMARHAVV